MIAIISNGDYTARVQLPVERRQLAGALSYLGANHTSAYEIKYNEESDKGLSFTLECRGTVENAIAEKTKQYIDEQKSLSFDMSQVSRSLGYSREHITRSFLAVHHITPKQYFNQQRMRIALEKLLDGVGVNEVADELHYSSPYAFSKAFRKHFGFSPTKYVKMLRPDQIKSDH